MDRPSRHFLTQLRDGSLFNSLAFLDGQTTRNHTPMAADHLTLPLGQITATVRCDALAAWAAERGPDGLGRADPCRMSGLVVSGLNAHDVTWSECKLDGVNLRAATLERSQWSDSVMNEADIYAARLTTSSFYRCDLTSAEFSKAQCDRVNLHGSTLAGIGGADSLSGCCIGSDQVVDLALPLLAAMRIVIRDDTDESP